MYRTQQHGLLRTKVENGNVNVAIIYQDRTYLQKTSNTVDLEIVNKGVARTVVMCRHLNENVDFYGTPGLSYMEIKYYIEYFSHYMRC